jgi:hypothetical protein
MVRLAKGHAERLAGVGVPPKALVHDLDADKLAWNKDVHAVTEMASDA